MFESLQNCIKQTCKSATCENISRVIGIRVFPKKKFGTSIKYKEIFDFFCIFEKIKIMSLALKNTTIDKYFGFLSKLDNVSKKRLIVKLTESIEVKEKKNFDLASLYGAWEDTRSSDEIISDIKNSRVEKKDSINL